MHPHLTIPRGRALVLTGPQGCGKGLHARALAAKYGTYAEIQPEQLTHRMLLDPVLAREPRTLIVEGWPGDKRGMATLKLLLTSADVAVNVNGQEGRPVRSPAVVITTDDADLPDTADERRFFVVRLPKGRA